MGASKRELDGRQIRKLLYGAGEVGRGPQPRGVPTVHHNLSSGRGSWSRRSIAAGPKRWGGRTLCTATGRAQPEEGQGAMAVRDRSGAQCLPSGLNVVTTQKDFLFTLY